jgi:hypothetical protein
MGAWGEMAAGGRMGRPPSARPAADASAARAFPSIALSAMASLIALSCTRAVKISCHTPGEISRVEAARTLP